MQRPARTHAMAAVRPLGLFGLLMGLMGIATLTLACAGAKKRSQGETPEDPAAAVDLAALTRPQPRDPAMRLLAVDATRCDPSGKRIEQQDLNRDGRADLITLTLQSGDESGVVTCKQGDLNHDGRIDAYIHYGGRGEIVREQFDLDHDGRIDLGRYYDEAGLLTLDEEDLNHDGYVDAWRRYEQGRLIRVEIDRDHDGRPDQFTFFVAGQIDRIGYDTTGDGKVDRWDQEIASRVQAAVDARRRSVGSEAVEYVDAPVADPATDPPAKSGAQAPEPSADETGDAPDDRDKEG